MNYLEEIDSAAPVFTDATVTHCVFCGSTQETVAMDAFVLCVVDPVCCEVEAQ